MSKLSKRKKQRKPAKQIKQKLRKLEALNWQEAVSLYEKHDREAKAWIQNRYVEYVRRNQKAADATNLMRAIRDHKREFKLASMNAAAEEYELAMAAQEIIGG